MAEGDNTRDELRLRTITVSTHAALVTAGDNRLAVDAVKVRSRALLEDLDRTIREDGADAGLLARIEEARRDLD